MIDGFFCMCCDKTEDIIQQTVFQCNFAKCSTYIFLKVSGLVITFALAQSTILKTAYFHSQNLSY